MRMIKSIPTYIVISFILILVSFSSMVSAKLFLKTEIVSGKVVTITADNTIELDDGYLYYPDRKTESVLIQPKAFITLKYYIDMNLDRKYIEYAPGKNSLSPTPVPVTIKSNKKF